MATFRRTLERSWWRRLLETLELLQKVRCWPPLLPLRHRPHHHLLHHRLHRLRLHRLRQLPAEAANGAALFASKVPAQPGGKELSRASLRSSAPSSASTLFSAPTRMATMKEPKQRRITMVDQ